ncbi:MarR family winged helix-turn-helix transcriptional regulator [Arenibacterium sp. CAU 1754]
MAKPDPTQSTTTDHVDHVSDDTLRNLLGYNTKRAFNVIHGDLADTLKPFDLRMITFTALVLIVDNPGLRQSQLADALAIERPNLVVIIDELERRDLIVRDRVPTDRRAYALKATLLGRQLYEKVTQAVQAHEAALLGQLSAEEHAQVIAAMRLIEGLRKRGEDT